MERPALTLVVHFEADPGREVRLHDVARTRSVASVIAAALARFGLPQTPEAWRLIRHGEQLANNAQIGSTDARDDLPVELFLRNTVPIPDSAGEVLAWSMPPMFAESAEIVDDLGSDDKDIDFELAISDADARHDEDESDSRAVLIDDVPLIDEDGGEVVVEAGDEDADSLVGDYSDELPSASDARPGDDEAGPQRTSTAPSPPAPEPSVSPRAKPNASPDFYAKRAPPTPVTVRATARYYSRANPDRVYPLLVVISKGVVENIRQRGTDQRTSKPFASQTGVVVEVEPVLPGCDCYPPRLVTRITGADQTLTFRMVPRVLGAVEGVVVVRQNHSLLTEVNLDINVVQRTWVYLSGACTFLLPGVSAALKHFKLDFQSQQQTGFDVYLATARLVFDRLPPLALAGVLAALTLAVYLCARPRRADAFSAVKTVGPGERLRQILASGVADPEQAWADLAELLQQFPDHRPTWLVYAESHADAGSHETAVKAYTRAFRLGTANARHYHRAAFTASQLGRTDTALAILELADRVLPQGQMTGVMLFNLGCYQTRLGRHDDAVASLRRAVAAGFRKPDPYNGDADLEPLRGRNDYRELVACL